MATAPKKPRRNQVAKTTGPTAAKPAATKAFVPAKYQGGNRNPTGLGQFPVTGQAAKRLAPRTLTPTFPGSPIPQLEQISGDSVITPQRLYYFKLTRYNPIRRLTPENLGNEMDLWEQGYIRYFALTADKIANRDDILQTVIPKREAAVRRLQWQVNIIEDLPKNLQSEAEKHQEALHYFYDNLSASSAVDLNVNAEIKTFLGQMMHARRYRWAVHEIIWQPSSEGLTARMNEIPIWFFENRTGKLRFLEMDYQLDGRELMENSFLITTDPTGNGLMEPCAVAYMFKHLSMRDFLMYSQKLGMPGVAGKTDASPDSQRWQDMQQAVYDIANDFSIVMSKEEEIEKLDFAATGELPMPKIVDLMNRTLASMWRGADLSTISGSTSQGGQGALLQGKEEYNLQNDDASLITETLNRQIDMPVIEWYFGEGVKPLAHFKLVVPPLIEAATDITIVDAFNRWGIEVGKKQMQEHFGMSAPLQGDDPIDPPMTGLSGAGKAGSSAGMQNPLRTLDSELEVSDERMHNELRLNPSVERALLESSLKLFANGTHQALKPVADLVKHVLSFPNEQINEQASKLRTYLPTVLKEINQHPENAKSLNEAMTAGFFNGLVNAHTLRVLRR